MSIPQAILTKCTLNWVPQNFTFWKCWQNGVAFMQIKDIILLETVYEITVLFFDMEPVFISFLGVFVIFSPN